MTTKMRLEHRHLEVACDLDVADLRARAAEWQALRESGLAAEAIPGGARMWLRAEAVPIAQDIVRREARCCGFFDFEIGVEGDRFRLDITSPAPEGAQVAAFLAGLEYGIASGCC